MSKKRVLVTGASAGFGFDLVKSLAERGHKVFATMRGVDAKNKEKAQALEAFAKEGGHELRVLELDVTSDASVNQAVKAAVEDGGLDVVVNNAGIGNFGIDEGFEVGQAQKIFDVNVFGVMRVNHAVLPHFRDQGKGVIVYVSSGLGRVVFPFVAAYGASKFAVEGFAEAAAIELSPLGIESVIVQPGAYGTSFLANTLQPTKDVNSLYGATAKAFEAFVAGFEERAKSGGMGDPAEVVNVIVEEVERTGERPLRRPVGADMAEPVGAINQVCGQVQDQMLQAFGMK